jgi:hypothetical protein
VNNVNTAALQWKSLIGKILYGRREIQFAVEPRLDRVLIGRDDIDEMPRLQRPQMGIDNIRGKLRTSCAARFTTHPNRQMPSILKGSCGGIEHASRKRVGWRNQNLKPGVFTERL